MGFNTEKIYIVANYIILISNDMPYTEIEINFLNNLKFKTYGKYGKNNVFIISIFKKIYKKLSNNINNSLYIDIIVELLFLPRDGASGCAEFRNTFGLFYCMQICLIPKMSSIRNLVWWGEIFPENQNFP